jgi:hypothetical protein
MAGKSGQTDPKAALILPSKHSYLEYEGTMMWASVERALAELVTNGDLVEQTNRKYIVGYFCEVLSAKKGERVLVSSQQRWTTRMRRLDE